MRVLSLKLSGFRNFSEISFSPDPGVNIFWGPNGSGKTNLLEAIFVLCLGRSQRGVGSAILISDESETFHLQGQVSVGEYEHDVAVAFQRGGRRKLLLDGSSASASRLFETFCVVSSGPEDSTILSGSPSLRRNFIDIYLSQMSQRYLSSLTDYQRVLTQRNAALKDRMDPGPFDDLLIETGSQIIVAREHFLSSLAPVAAEQYGTISGDHEFAMAYHPSVSITTGMNQIDTVKESFATKLTELHQREQLQMVTLCGPHRDDVNFMIDGRPTRTHASRGELRSAAISLKQAVFTMLAETRQITPVLLLDEMFGELDENRRGGLMNSLNRGGQCFLTTAGEVPQGLESGAASYKIIDGEIARVS